MGLLDFLKRGVKNYGLSFIVQMCILYFVLYIVYNGDNKKIFTIFGILFLGLLVSLILLPIAALMGLVGVPPN